jgi:hypothetical protein
MATKRPNRTVQKTPLKLKPLRAAVRPAKRIPKLLINRPLPTKSVHKATKAFKNFSLSRFPVGAVPNNFVPTGQAKVPAAVHAVQRKAIVRRLVSMANSSPIAAPGLTVALPDKLMQSLLPSLDAAAGVVKVSELLGALRQQMRGTDFYAVGNPTLNRVVQDSALLSQVQAFINAIKAGGP